MSPKGRLLSEGGPVHKEVPTNASIIQIDASSVPCDVHVQRCHPKGSPDVFEPQIALYCFGKL